MNMHAGTPISPPDKKVNQTLHWKAQVYSTSPARMPLDLHVGTGRRLLSQEIPPDFPPPENIRPHEQFVADHPQRRLLLKGEALSVADIEAIQQPFAVRGLVGIGATIPAASRPSHPFPEKGYHRHEWVRDAVVGVEALLNAGQHAHATEVLTELLTYLSLPAQRDRIVEYHFTSSAHGTPRDLYHLDFAKRPFVRSVITPEGRLADRMLDRDGAVVEDAVHWAHDQLGSFGQLIRLACRAHRRNLIDLNQVYSHVIERVGAITDDATRVQHLRNEHILTSLQKFLYRVALVHPAGEDVQLSINTRGAWEEGPARNRLSEMIPLLAGAQEFMRLYDAQPRAVLLAGDTKHRRQFIENLQIFTHALELEINRQLPSRPYAVARETLDSNVLDSVVALQLSPRLIKLTALQQFAIIRTVLRNSGLADDCGVLDAPGIIRYRGDPYAAADMHRSADINWNVHHSKLACHWTLMDPAIAAHFFMRAHELGTQQGEQPQMMLTLGREYYRYGCRFLQRSASQVLTKPFVGWVNAGEGQRHRVAYAPYEPVEGFYLNSDTGRWQPNPNCLNWTTAQRALMFHWARVASQLYGGC